MQRRHTAGFTLIELMVTLAVMTVLMLIAYPNFSYTMRSSKVSSSTNELVASMSLARMEAIKSGNKVGVICPSADGISCGADWSQGWIVWTEAAGAAGAAHTFDTGTDTVVRYSNITGVAIAGPTDPLVFDARGRRVNAAVALVLKASTCPAGNKLSRNISVGPTGQATVVQANCP